MQFFVYYVFWPLVLGIGLAWTLIMDSASVWFWAIAWMLPWLTWPVGKYRRRFLGDNVLEFTTQAHETGESSLLGALVLSVGPALIMVMSAWFGATVTPVVMESFMDIDVQARIEEMQQHVDVQNQ